MPLPVGNNLHIHAFFNRARDEHSTQGTLAERRISQASAGPRQSFLCIRNFEYAFIVRLALTETLQQRAHLREERHCKTGRRLVAKRNDPLCVEIHIPASE